MVGIWVVPSFRVPMRLAVLVAWQKGICNIPPIPFIAISAHNHHQNIINETDINPPEELGRLADASGGERSTIIKTPVV